MFVKQKARKAVNAERAIRTENLDTLMWSAVCGLWSVVCTLEVPCKNFLEVLTKHMESQQFLVNIF